jgi:hypothetical protein
MAKKANPQYMIEGVEALWPRLNRPYHYDIGERRSVPCDALDDGAEYGLNFKMDKATAKALFGWMTEVYEAARTDKWPDLKNPFTKNDDGTYSYKTNLKAAYNGEKTTAPKQYDAKAKPLPANFELTTGSTVNLSIVGIPYSAKIGNGVSLRLRAVQVTALAEKVTSSPFEATDGFEFDSDNVFSAQPVKKAAPAMDDEELEAPKKRATKKSSEEAPESITDALDEWAD